MSFCADIGTEASDERYSLQASRGYGADNISGRIKFIFGGLLNSGEFTHHHMAINLDR